jgi:hypothetical protein
MANTFKALTELADWAAPPAAFEAPPAVLEQTEPGMPEGEAIPPERPLRQQESTERLQLHYNIQIHLPESRDPAVFDAIFQALRKHLA